MRREALYLQDILLAAEALERFLSGKTEEGFAADEVLMSAATQKLLVIGEAAARLPESVRELAAEVPWQAIVGMRNRLLMPASFGELPRRTCRCSTGVCCGSSRLNTRKSSSVSACPDANSPVRGVGKLIRSEHPVPTHRAPGLRAPRERRPSPEGSFWSSLRPPQRTQRIAEGRLAWPSSRLPVVGPIPLSSLPPLR